MKRELTRWLSRAPRDTLTPTPEPELEPDSEPELDKDEIQDYEELRSVFGPRIGLQLLDSFAKWLFALAGTVGTVGAGFGVSSANHLSSTGRSCFAWAVASVAISLALAALSRLPIPVNVNRYSPDSMKRGVRKLLWIRFWLLGLATGLFATALILAGIAQVV